MEIKLIDIADTPHKQELGLQFYRGLPKNTGMLFVFQSSRVLSFWMKNVYTPLDIAFIDKDNKIIKVETMVPLSLRSITSGSPCKMALEAAPGTLGGCIGKQVTVDTGGKKVTID